MLDWRDIAQALKTLAVQTNVLPLAGPIEPFVASRSSPCPTIAATELVQPILELVTRPDNLL